MQIRVHARRGHLVDVPADLDFISSHAIEVAIAGLDRRVYGEGIAVHASEVMQIGKHSGWRQPENAAEASCRIPCDASSVEVSIAAQREPSATTMGPLPREAEKHAFHSSRRYLVDRAAAVRSADVTTPVHIAVAALHDVAFGLAGVGRKK